MSRRGADPEEIVKDRLRFVVEPHRSAERRQATVTMNN